ncbi:hypothetical protein H2203_008317 [Taxawa tesnikishii (nom. ined.)]|nr:hypothetical protein H2203_008317 [Dothideales sp. JES 119]
MAPIPPSSDTSSIPLADHFFIAGIESSQVYDDRIPAPPSASPPVDTTIDEDEALETNPRTPRPVTPSSPEGGKRRSRYSFEARKSIGSIISASELKGTATARHLYYHLAAAEPVSVCGIGATMRRLAKGKHERRREGISKQPWGTSGRGKSEAVEATHGTACGEVRFSRREELEDQISATEEKISLMTDLLRPVRHGAASKIDGLTDGETGFWIPRVYGVLGRDGGLTSFWKEWLRAVIVPMTNGGVLRVPPSSPKVGMWQPLERYVVNMCVEAPSPMSSITQVEVAVRELRLYARKEAINELPGSRNTDLYALFRALSIPNIVTLFEYALAESRIILLSSHTAMLHLASAALASLLYPMKWASVFIPVLPYRLIQALEAPCPYIIGVERRYDQLELPDDDFVLVDLDQDVIESTARPTCLPRQQRRKLMALLQAAAPHHTRFGTPIGPPAYATETYPNDAFPSENPQVFSPRPEASTLAAQATLSVQRLYADTARHQQRQRTSFDELDWTRQPAVIDSIPTFPYSTFPISLTFPTTPVSRNDSGFGLQTSLREKRSGHFDSVARRNSSIGFGSINALRRPSATGTGHALSMSTSNITNGTASTYAPSTYAQSTLAASTVMPGVSAQPVRDTDTTKWIEGHCLAWRPREDRTTCAICDEKCHEGVYRCTGCSVTAHSHCARQITLVCPAAFCADLVRAAFVRCFATLFYTYRRFLHPASGDRRKAGLLYHFNMEGFLRSLPQENAEYMAMLQQTQAFNEFIHERESTRGEDPSIKLFDEIVLSKKNRSRTSIFSKSTISFLSDTSDHLWRSAVAAPPNSRFPGNYRSVVTRIPAKLDPTLMKEPRALQGAPRILQNRTKRKPIPSMLGLPASESK